jgi:SAM-dependent methyltransferase
MLTDWAKLWAELASQDIMASPEGEAHMIERWRHIAGRLDSGEMAEPDPLLDCVRGRLGPEMSVVDIGAGIGRWTIPLAETVQRVTAVEPLAGMCTVLHERVSARGLLNVTVVDASWMAAEVGRHDAAIAVHATYTTPDLLGFVGKMEARARTCYLVLRVPVHEGLIGELSQAIRQQWHDSPNFIVGYNLLLASGRYPNVLIEPKATRHWFDTSLEDAVARAKRHLKLTGTAHDRDIRDILARKLTAVKGGYRWPDGMRSALVWWGKA